MTIVGPGAQAAAAALAANPQAAAHLDLATIDDQPVPPDQPDELGLGSLLTAADARAYGSCHRTNFTGARQRAGS